MLPVNVTPRLRTSACAGSRIRSALVEFEAVLATTCVRATTLPLGSHDEALRGLELT